MGPSGKIVAAKSPVFGYTHTHKHRVLGYMHTQHPGTVVLRITTQVSKFSLRSFHVNNEHVLMKPAFTYDLGKNHG